MNKKRWSLVAICTCLILSFAAYQLLYTPMTDNTSSGTDDDGTSNIKDQTTATPSTTDQSGDSTTPTDDSSETEEPSSDTDTTNTNSSTEHEEDHEDAADYVYDSSQVANIELNGNSITANSTTALIQHSTITLLTAGTYKISGVLTEGQIIVNTQDTATVQLILSNVDITCSTSAPIYIMDAKKAIIILEDNTANTLTDKHTVNLADDPNAAIYSTCDLTIYGSGTLAVQGNNDGITSKDGLIIKSGTITVSSNDDGIRGKDYLIVKDGKITVAAGENGFLSDNADDSTMGYISVESGTINIVAGGDAVSAETDVTITGGQITATAGGGSSSSTTNSAKAVKGLTSVLISSGTFTLNCADDAIHSNGTVTINGGTFSISTGDDAIHADSAVTITAGTIDITKSYEGIESVTITINGGTININSSDDGINGAGGNDASGTVGGPGMGGQGGQDGFQNSGDCNLYINGGYIVVSASGDGVDVNGAVTMTSGTLIINGPTSNFNGALDHGSFKMTGGLLVAVGSSGMAQAPDTTSTQYSILVNFRTAYSAQTLIHIESSTGTSILTFKPTKQFQSIAFCSPSLTKGSTYDIYVGGSSTGTLKDGIYSNGVYTGGTKYASLTINNIVTTANYW